MACEEVLYDQRILVDIDDDEAELAGRRQAMLVGEGVPAFRAPGREEFDDRELARHGVRPRAAVQCPPFQSRGRPSLGDQQLGSRHQPQRQQSRHRPIVTAD